MQAQILHNHDDSDNVKYFHRASESSQPEDTRFRGSISNLQANEIERLRKRRGIQQGHGIRPEERKEEGLRVKLHIAQKREGTKDYC